MKAHDAAVTIYIKVNRALFRLISSRELISSRFYANQECTEQDFKAFNKAMQKIAQRQTGMSGP
jgi:hypothetical protein